MSEENKVQMFNETEKSIATKHTPATLKSLLEGEVFKQQVAKSLPKHLSPDRFIRIALTALMRTPKLAQCDQISFFNCLLKLSQLGLEPDGRQAHLIPFENNKRGCTECQLIVDYKGKVEIIMRTGLVAFVHADVICENDSFEYDKGAIKTHRIDFKKDRGSAYAAYAICRFKDGTEKCEVMTKEEIEAVRARSKAGKCGPWVTDWREMAKKTVFHRLSKWIPVSAEYRDSLDMDDDRFEDMKQVSGEILRPVPRVQTPEKPSIPNSDPSKSAEATIDDNSGNPSSNNDTNTYTASSSEPPIHDQISILVQEQGVSEAKLVSILRNDGLLTEFQQLKDLKEDDAISVLKTINVYIAKIKKMRF